jgi:hypothetical protein
LATSADPVRLVPSIGLAPAADLTARVSQTRDRRPEFGLQMDRACAYALWLGDGLWARGRVLRSVLAGTKREPLLSKAAPEVVRAQVPSVAAKAPVCVPRDWGRQQKMSGRACRCRARFKSRSVSGMQEGFTKRAGRDEARGAYWKEKPIGERTASAGLSASSSAKKTPEALLFPYTSEHCNPWKAAKRRPFSRVRAGRHAGRDRRPPQLPPELCKFQRDADPGL